MTSSLPHLAPTAVAGAQAAGPRRPALARAALVVGPATMAANLLGYAFTVVVSRALGPDGFGALGALLGLLLIGAVPALALQAVTARRVAVAAPADVPGVVRGLLRASVLLGLGTSGLLLLAVPATTAYLHLDGPLPAVWLALSLAPVAVVSAGQGALQGAERFSALAVVFVAAAGLRLAGGAVAVLADTGITGVLVGTTAGSVLAAGVAVGLARRCCGRAARRTSPHRLGREVGLAAFGLLGLAALANVDVLLARHHLAPREAGLYAVGAVLAKAAFWAPQVVAVVVFPRLAGDRAREALRTALLCVAAVGAVLVLATAALARPLLDLLFGEAYVGVAPIAWAFTALGATLALTQLLVVNGIAAQTRVTAVLVAAGVVAAAVVISVWLHDSAGQIVGVALGCRAAVLVVAAVLSRRRLREPVAALQP